jgi:hypothetical protein
MEICNHLRGSLRSSRDDYRILAQEEPMESRTRSNVLRKCGWSQDMVVYDKIDRRKSFGRGEKNMIDFLSLTVSKKYVASPNP